MEVLQNNDVSLKVKQEKERCVRCVTSCKIGKTVFEKQFQRRQFWAADASQG